MFRITVAVAAVALLALTGRGAELAELPLADAPTALLGGRLLIRLPDVATLEPHEPGPMTGRTTAQVSSRVTLETDGKALILLAEDFIATAGEDFSDLVEQMNDEQSGPNVRFLGKRVVNQDGFQVYQYWSKPVVPHPTMSFVTGAWIVNSDGTVQRLSIYANPAATAAAKDVMALTEKLLQSLAPGERALVTETREQILYVHSDEKVLSTSLPDGWVYTCQPGPDFVVHRLKKLSPFGTEGAKVGMYVGREPNFQSSIDDRPQKLTAILLGEQTEWYRLMTGNRRFFESIRELHELGQGDYLHVFLSAHNPEDLAEALNIVNALRYVDAPDPSTLLEPDPEPEPTLSTTADDEEAAIIEAEAAIINIDAAAD